MMDRQYSSLLLVHLLALSLLAELDTKQQRLIH